MAGNLIDAIIENLELERELGTRSFEIDPASLACPRKAPPPAPAKTGGETVERPRGGDLPRPASAPRPKKLPFVFIHDRPLGEASLEFLSKARLGLGVSEDEAPLAVAQPVPNAAVYIMMGVRALRMFAPGSAAEFGRMGVSRGGRKYILTYSPDEITRFGTVSPAVEKMKKTTWLSFKLAAAEAARTLKEEK